jgi:hypothetical protein
MQFKPQNRVFLRENDSFLEVLASGDTFEGVRGDIKSFLSDSRESPLAKSLAHFILFSFPGKATNPNPELSELLSKEGFSTEDSEF